MYRLFIAIDFPDDVKDDLANICFGVPGAKWVSREQMHLTIRFIGEVDEAGYQAVSSGLSDVNVSGFSLSLKGVGYFPPRNQPKVLWAGIEKNESLVELRDFVESSLRESGIPQEERKFAAHVTLARLGLKTPLDAVMKFLSGNGLFSSGPVPVDEFHLYSSVLTNTGPIHRREATYELL
jgi:RNA 2',3'-cyclic 3'-phosphodiesterase